LSGAATADNLIKQGMTQQRTPADTGSDAVRQTRKRRIILTSMAGLVLIGGLILCLPDSDSHQNLLDRMRLGWDEHRRAFDQRRRAWEEQRRAEEQARRTAATAASGNQTQLPLPTPATNQ
jgi:hypothetical protein